MYLSSAQLEETTMINWVSQTFCIMAIATGKVSIAILMGRLMSPSRWRKWVLYILSISSMMAACIIIIFIFAQCSPPKALWILSAGKCWDPRKMNHLDVALASVYKIIRDFYCSTDVDYRLVCIRGFCPCCIWGDYDLELTNEEEAKGRSKCPSWLGILVSTILGV